MKAVDRDAELGRLRDGELDVLVGTTVLEVGVDVPRATMMVVQSADRFGLAQLHQLRGRVGRGDVQSYCALVSEAAPSTRAWKQLVAGRADPETTEQARLVAVARTNDGFELAEKDWELRREGDVLGLVQSGLPRLRVASLQNIEHRELVGRAREHAEGLLDEAGRLRPEADALRRELGRGWLDRVAAGEPRREPERRVADAGRVIAGSAAGLRLTAPGERRGLSATASSRRSSRSSSPIFRAPGCSTCSPAAGRAASRRCRAAPHRPCSSSGMPPRRSGDRARTCGGRTESDRRRIVRAEVAAGSLARARLTRGTSSWSIRRTRSRSCWSVRSRRSAAVVRPGGRVVAKHFWRGQAARPRSGC